MLSLFTGFLDPVTCTTWLFEGLNPISHLVSHADKMLRSFWSVELSWSLSNVRYKAVSSANSRTWEQTLQIIYIDQEENQPRTHPLVVPSLNISNGPDLFLGKW